MALISLTGITAITGEFIECKSVVRKRTATGSISSVDAFMVIMKREKFTGKITIDMSQGGVRGIAAEDRQTIID